MANKLTILWVVIGLMSIVNVSQATSNLIYNTPKDGALRKGFNGYTVLVIQGANSTIGYNTVRSASPAQPQPFSFGDYYTLDLPILSAKDINSTVLGRAQGHLAFVQQTGGVVFVAETFVINNGANLGGINGTFSSIGLEYLGLNSTKPIVGGTGDFEFVMGIVTTVPLSPPIDSNGNLNMVMWFMYNFRFKWI